MTISLREVYLRLFSAFGPQHWWPGESPFEVVVGAVLVQNTAWKNVEKAIDNLRQRDLLEPRPLYDLPVAQLEDREAGIGEVAAVMELAQWLVRTVELIREVADQVFENVGERDQAGGAAELVDHDAHVLSSVLHLAQGV